MKQVKNLLQKNVYDIYMLLLIGLTYLRYTNHIGNIYFIVLITIAITMILLRKNVFYLFPIALVAQMSFGAMRDNTDITVVFGSIIIILLVFDVIWNRKVKRSGLLTFPLAVMCFATILSMFDGISTYSNLVSFFQIFSVLMLYLYFMNTLEEETPYEMLGKMLIYLSVLVTVEMLHYTLTSELEIIEVIRTRSIDLGWENLNVIIYVNLMSIPLIGYIITKSKYKLYYMILAVFVVLGILMTLSRSSILSLGVFALVCVPLIALFDNNKMQLLIQGLLFILFLVIGIRYLENQAIVTEYFETLFERELTYYDDRLILLDIALESFLKYPIFGEGGVFASRYIMEANGLTAINYHNTIAQTTTMGLFGLGTFIYLFARKFKLLFESTDYFKWFAITLLVVTAFINGMLQPMYYYTSYMFYMFMVLALIEVKTTKKDV